MDKSRPVRKPQRLPKFDYSEKRAYFITLCTQNRRLLFGSIFEDRMKLSEAGEMIRQTLAEITGVYTRFTIHASVVMPNHVHLLLSIGCDGDDEGGTPRRAFPTESGGPRTISDFVMRFKTLTTYRYIEGVRSGLYPAFDRILWQKSFHDHIVRDQGDLIQIWTYIEHNPKKWALDRYYQ